MKKTLKKIMLTCAAVTALTAMMSLSAMAAVVYDDVTNTATYSGTDAALAGKQVTVLVLKPGADDTNITASDIAYIGQQAADSEGKYTFVMPLAAGSDEGKYTIKSGGEGVTAIVQDDFNIGDVEEDYKLGDVNDDTDIDTQDAILIIDHFAGQVTLTGKAFLAADIVKDNEVDTQDAIQVIDYFVGQESILK